MADAKNDIAIKVSNVSKSFKLPHESQNSLKGKLINFNKRGYEIQEALKDISFEVKRGEFFGIVGRNGSGKSTLLKILSGIYAPNAGSVQINGKLTPFIELGVGFNPELSGRDNVYLNGALLGFSRKEMDEMYNDIVDFAELERFMDQKLKNYSSGMQVRLAFSIAIRANSDILVLDEVLAVGDEAFQRKCFTYFAQLKKEGKTVILVTHDMNSVQRFCSQAMLINDTQIVYIGDPSEVATRYSALSLGSINSKTAALSDKVGHMGTGAARLSVRILDGSGEAKESFLPEEKIIVEVKVKANDALVSPRIGVAINDTSGRCVFASNTRVKGISVPDTKKGKTVTVSFELKNIYTDGIYKVSSAVASNEDETVYDRIEDICVFESGGWALKHALVHGDHLIKVKS